MEKLKTGVKELDDILGGGIPKGHSVLLAGSCGTGKTILSQQFLFTGSKDYNDLGIYIILSESEGKMVENLKNFSFFDKKLLDEGKVKILDITQDARLTNLEPLTVGGMLNMITSIIRDSEAKRVVVDSITAVCNSLGSEKKVRDFILELGLQLQYSNCTTLFISEVPPMKLKYSMFGVEEFIADGVILLKEYEHKADLLRTLQVIKMRGVNHSRAKHLLEITDSGISLKPWFEFE